MLSVTCMQWQLQNLGDNPPASPLHYSVAQKEERRFKSTLSGWRVVWQNWRKKLYKSQTEFHQLKAELEEFAVWLCKLLPQISVQYSRSYTAHLRGLCIIRLQSNRQNKYFIQVSVQPYMEVEPIVKNAKHVSWVYISQLKSFINHQQWMSSETDVA